MYGWLISFVCVAIYSFVINQPTLALIPLMVFFPIIGLMIVKSDWEKRICLNDSSPKESSN